MINKTCSIGACIHISHVTWITLYNVEPWKQFGTDQWPQQMTNECLDSSTYTINEVNCVQCIVQYTSDDISFYSISFRSVLSCSVLLCYALFNFIRSVMCLCVWMLHYELHNCYNNKMFAPFPLFVFRCFFVCRNCNLSQSCDFRPWYFEQIKLFIVFCNLSYVRFFSKCSAYIERYSASCIFMTQYFDRKCIWYGWNSSEDLFVFSRQPKLPTFKLLQNVWTK